MPDILIRDVPEDVARALTEKALKDGTMDRQAWLRKKLIELAAQPTIRDRYQFKAFSEQGAQATIRRHIAATGVGGGATNCSQEHFAAYKRARLLAERKELADTQAR